MWPRDDQPPAVPPRAAGATAIEGPVTQAAPPSRAIEVRNVVAVTRVAGRLAVNDLAAVIPGATLDTRMPKMVVHLASPAAAVLAYTSGKVIVTGLKDAEAVAPAFEAVLETLRAAGADLEYPMPPARVVNVVASGSLGMRVLLYRLAFARNFDRVEFDPEQFPGLVYRSEAGPVALIFGTGSIVVTGARSLEGAEAAADEVRSIIDTAGAWLPG